MPEFSARSIEKLDTCHPLLRLLFKRVIEGYDCTVVWGFRDEATQNKFYQNGRSQKKWPDGPHNTYPSLAADVAPYINGSVSYDIKQCYQFAGYVLGVADMLGIQIINGGDWNRNRNIYDQTFNDLTHFQLAKESL